VEGGGRPVIRTRFNTGRENGIEDDDDEEEEAISTELHCGHASTVLWRATMVVKWQAQKLELQAR
jgi:hypothetical protein